MIVAQLVRASDCGSEGRGFETRLSPKKAIQIMDRFFYPFYFPYKRQQYIKSGRLGYSYNLIEQNNTSKTILTENSELKL